MTGLSQQSGGRLFGLLYRSIGRLLGIVERFSLFGFVNYLDGRLFCLLYGSICGLLDWLATREAHN